MGRVDPSAIQRIKGDLVLSPTDLTAASPYGGTLLGPIRDGTFYPGGSAEIVRAEEWGGQAVDLIHGADEARLAVVLRSWDADALAVAVPHSEAGSSGERLWTFQPAKDDDDTVRPGRGLAESYGVTLCVAPRATDRQMFLVLYNAVPAVELAHRLRFSLDAEFDLGLVWYGLPDDSGRVFAIGRKGDITL